jgi:antirestriction protein ArdC
MKRKDRNKILLSKLKDLSSELVTDPDKLKAFADRWRGGFRQYSFYNLLLIACQRNDASLCAGFKQWNKHNRFVMKGQEALWILAPGFIKVKDKNGDGEEEEEGTKQVKYFFSVPVFDISQTSGQDLVLGNSEVKGNGDLTLDDVSAKFDFPMKVNESLADGSTDGKSIKVAKRTSQAQMVAAYFHELAHILLDHAKDRGYGLSREVKELEAEATSYLVCSCVGIENEGAKKYIGHWKGTVEKIDKSAMKILGTAEKILRQVKPEFFNHPPVMAC